MFRANAVGDGRELVCNTDVYFRCLRDRGLLNANDGPNLEAVLNSRTISILLSLLAGLGVDVDNVVMSRVEDFVSSNMNDRTRNESSLPGGRSEGGGS